MALQQGKCLRVTYKGYSRLVEVHAVGETKAGSGIMRVYQVDGGSESGQPVGFKLMTLSEVDSASVSDRASEAPRPGYKKGDSAMLHITCQL